MKMEEHNKKKQVWIINQYITTPILGGKTHRHFGLARCLKKDNNITLFTGTFSHLHNNKPLKKINEEGIEIINFKLIKYKNMVLRVFNMFQYVFKLRLFQYKTISKPDIIVISSMSLLPLLLINYYKKIFPQVKIVHEIRDLWPLTPILMGGYSNKHPFIKLLSHCEKIGYEKADFFVSNLSKAYLHIKKNTVNREEVPFSWVSNGFDNKEQNQKLSKDIFEKIPKDKFLIGYAGTLGIANSMDRVIDAMNLLLDRDIHLCIVGRGYLKEKLKLKSNKNVSFLGEIPKNQVNCFLKIMDICILSWQDLEIYKYGISPNKIFDYMYASKPILMIGKINDTIIDKSDCGWVLKELEPATIALKIIEISELNFNYLNNLGSNGRMYLDENFTYEKLASKFQIEVLDKL